MSVKVLILLSLLSIAFAKDDGFKFIRKVYEDCSRTDVVSCLKKKAILFFDRASRMDVIPLVEGIDVVKSGNAEVQPISENEIDAILPRNLGKDDALNEVLWDRVASFANSRTIQLSLPKISGEELNKGVEEGRGKMKKMMGMMMMGGAMKMMAMLPLGMAGLFVLAGKALIVAKIALLLSGLMILKKLMSQKGGGGGGHGGGGHESHGWSSGGGGYDRRSYDGSDLAYSGYNSDNKKDSHAPNRK